MNAVGEMYITKAHQAIPRPAAKRNSLMGVKIIRKKND